MKVLHISKTEKPSRSVRLGSAGLTVVHLSPTLLSPITAMRAAKIIDKQEIGIVEVDTPQNAMAAISARQLCKTRPKIVMLVGANTAIPRSIPKDLRKGVDLWLFESRRLMELYPDELKKAFCGITSWDMITSKDVNEDCDKVEEKCTEKVESKNPEAGKNVLRLGDINNADALRLALNTVNDSSRTIDLRICGAGNAATVMPLVRYHRSLPHGHRIVWVGEEYDSAKEITRCDILLQADSDINPEEAKAILAGKHIIDNPQLIQMAKTGEITEYAKAEADVLSPEVCAGCIAYIYNSI